MEEANSYMFVLDMAFIVLYSLYSSFLLAIRTCKGRFWACHSSVIPVTPTLKMSGTLASKYFQTESSFFLPAQSNEKNM